MNRSRSKRMKIARHTKQLWRFISGDNESESRGSRLEALMCANVDPFIAALDFRGCYLQKTVFKCDKKVKDDILSGFVKTQGFSGSNNAYLFRPKNKKVMLTKKEKAFLIRRLACA